jgi:hypothetical protein
MSYDFERSTGDIGLSVASAILTTYPCSIAIWAKPESLTALNTNDIVYCHGGGSARYVRLGVYDTDTFAALDNAASASNQEAKDTSEALGTAAWKLIVGVWESNKITLYINSATPVATLNATLDAFPTISRVALGINGANGTTNEYDGKLAECAMWNNVALTSGNVTSLLSYYANSGHNSLPTPTAYWPLLNDTNDDIGSNHLSAYTNAPTVDAGDHPTLSAGGASVTITDADDETYSDGEPGITITGTGFGTGGGSSAIIISPTDNVADAGAVTQTETGTRSDTTATFTAVRGSIAFGATAYLFVKNSGGTANASGRPVSFITRGSQRRMMLGIG